LDKYFDCFLGTGWHFGNDDFVTMAKKLLGCDLKKNKPCLKREVN